MACGPGQGTPAVHSNSDSALETPTHTQTLTDHQPTDTGSTIKIYSSLYITHTMITVM